MKEIVFEILDLPVRKIALVAASTWLAAFGYQLAFYSYYHAVGSGLITSERTVFSYISGIVGDGVILPILNVVIYILLLQIRVVLTIRKLLSAAAVGFTLTALFHIAQATLNITNWSMPQAYVWSAMGRFHFLFMWAEFSFLALTLYEVLANLGEIESRPWTRLLFSMALAAVAAFLLTFWLDYQGLFSALRG